MWLLRLEAHPHCGWFLWRKITIFLLSLLLPGEVSIYFTLCLWATCFPTEENIYLCLVFESLFKFLKYRRRIQFRASSYKLDRIQFQSRNSWIRLSCSQFYWDSIAKHCIIVRLAVISLLDKGWLNNLKGHHSKNIHPPNFKPLDAWRNHPLTCCPDHPVPHEVRLVGHEDARSAAQLRPDVAEDPGGRK